MTALMVAAERKRFEVVEALVEAGADLNVKDRVSRCSHQNLYNDGKTLVLTLNGHSLGRTDALP